MHSPLVMTQLGVWLTIAPYRPSSVGTAAALVTGVLLLVLLRAILRTARDDPVAEAQPHEDAASRKTRALVRMLTEMGETSRRMMMHAHLRKLASMRQDQRKWAMRLLVETTLALPDEQAAALVLTRTRLLSDYTEQTRTALLQAHVDALREVPGYTRQRELHFVMQAVSQLPAGKRQLFERVPLSAYELVR